MVVSDFSSRGAVRSRQRGIATAADKRRGHTVDEFELWNVPLIERMSANQFERWLVKKFGASYLEPLQLYKDGGGI